MSDWIEWSGGVCPVPLTTKVEVRRRDGEKRVTIAIACGWSRNGWEDDVMAYRKVIK